MWGTPRVTDRSGRGRLARIGFFLVAAVVLFLSAELGRNLQTALGPLRHPTPTLSDWGLSGVAGLRGLIEQGITEKGFSVDSVCSCSDNGLGVSQTTVQPAPQPPIDPKQHHPPQPWLKHPKQFRQRILVALACLLDQFVRVA